MDHPASRASFISFCFIVYLQNICTVRKGSACREILDLFLRKTLSGKSQDYRDAIVFEKLRFQNDFLPHEDENPAFSNSPGLKSIFEKLWIRDGLEWTIGLTVEIKLRFLIFSGEVWNCLTLGEPLFFLSN